MLSDSYIKRMQNSDKIRSKRHDMTGENSILFKCTIIQNGVEPKVIQKCFTTKNI